VSLDSPLLSRLDRWLKRQYPSLTQGTIEKLLRQGKIRVNGQKATSGTRVSEVDTISVPEVFLKTLTQTPAPLMPYKPEDIDYIASLIIWEDEEICVLNKPSGLATQGGTKTTRHLDGLLQAYGCGKPFRLVHRLDRDTSGVLIVAKTLKMSIFLSDAFKKKLVKKVYWAIVQKTPSIKQGTINAPIAKVEEGSKEKMVVDFDDGKAAITEYRVLKSLKDGSSWLELKPETGRTHQLRVHTSYMGHPIIGDKKYGSTEDETLHLHSRKITIPISSGRTLTFVAPPPHHIEEKLKNSKINWESYA
jgi:23S rRNA pseudouridine955/2504/2580 synthase